MSLPRRLYWGHAKCSIDMLVFTSAYYKTSHIMVYSSDSPALITRILLFLASSAVLKPFRVAAYRIRDLKWLSIGRIRYNFYSPLR